MSDALTTRDLRRIVRCLRDGAPAGDVRVMRRPLVDALALASIRGGRARIAVDPRLGFDAAWLVLPHEWGHVLAWRRHGVEIQDHGDEWGIAQADATRALEREWARRGWRDC